MPDWLIVFLLVGTSFIILSMFFTDKELPYIAIISLPVVGLLISYLERRRRDQQ